MRVRQLHVRPRQAHLRAVCASVSCQYQPSVASLNARLPHPAHCQKKPCSLIPPLHVRPPIYNHTTDPRYIS